MDPANQDLIGTCGLFMWEQQTRMASFGYDLARPYWGQGLMREAAMAVIAYGFAVKDLNRINALIAEGNTRSARLLTTLGFRDEALLRQFAFWKGEFHDMQLFGLLRADVNHETAPQADRLAA
ncbi:MAG: GNAT family N-acetyltransferase [Thiomonas sp.]